jgi:hypothetical protein
LNADCANQADQGEEKCLQKVQTAHLSLALRCVERKTFG